MLQPQLPQVSFALLAEVLVVGGDLGRGHQQQETSETAVVVPPGPGHAGPNRPRRAPKRRPRASPPSQSGVVVWAGDCASPPPLAGAVAAGSASLLCASCSGLRLSGKSAHLPVPQGVLVRADYVLRRWSGLAWPCEIKSVHPRVRASALTHAGMDTESASRCGMGPLGAAQSRPQRRPPLFRPP